MDSNIIDGAKRHADIARQDMPALIDKIRYRRKPINIIDCYRLLRRDHLALGVYDYLSNRDVQNFKQHFYIASKLTLEILGKQERSNSSTGSEVFYALFSDHPEMVNLMAHMETPELIKERNNPLLPAFFVHMMQLAIRDEHEELQDKIKKVALHGKKPQRIEYASGQDFFSLLLKKDKVGLEQLIQHKHASLKSADPLFEDFMSYLAGWETKLCWVKGIPVQINGPLVPMDLMPVEPLAHYDDVYDFLQPGWSPPQQGILGSLSRLFNLKI